MGTQGKELLESIKSMRNFMGDIGQLLMTADGIMGEESWEPLWGTGCLAEMSYTVSSGHKWIPREAIRPYKNYDSYPGIIAVISILLDDYQREYKIQEPAVTASYFALPEETAKEAMKIEFWKGRCLGWCKVELDGTPDSIDKYEPEWKTTYGWKHMEVFGWPLVEITKETLLKERIIDPLLQMIDRYWNTTHE